MIGDDEPLEPEVREAVRAYHEPPPPPRDAMWARIQALRAGAPSGASGRERRRATRGARWPLWAAGAAALIALGVGFGRLSVHPPVAPAVAPTPPAPVAGGARDAAAYRFATAEHLGQAEVFLTLFRASIREGRRDRLAPATARQLLATNRLLLDSPAASDPKLKLLLQDVELVLAQIAQLAPDRRREDLMLITDCLERDGMLSRLRAAVPAGTGVTFRQGAL